MAKKSSNNTKKKNTGCEVSAGIAILRLLVIIGIVVAMAVYAQTMI